MRHGTLPGANLWAGGRISIWLAYRIRAASALPGAPGNTSFKGLEMTKHMNWAGVIPDITTPFKEDLSIDFGFLAEHCKLLVHNGCKGVVALGSLGEGGTLTRQEKER